MSERTLRRSTRARTAAAAKLAEVGPPAKKTKPTATRASKKKTAPAEVTDVPEANSAATESAKKTTAVTEALASTSIAAPSQTITETPAITKPAASTETPSTATKTTVPTESSTITNSTAPTEPTSTTALTDAPSTNVPTTAPPAAPSPSKPGPTPEQQARIEANRLRAKQIYEAKQRERELAEANSPKKRNAEVASENKKDEIRPAKKFASFVEYDLSKMTDTHGGFLSAPDDPLHGLDLANKPAGMSLADYAEQQRREKEREERKARQLEEQAKIPMLSANPEERKGKECFECGSAEIDWQMFTVFGCRVCKKCEKEKPDKYSLLTKTECREDYLLTDPELRDEELLPRLIKPNPHKSTYTPMQLFLRYQIEAFAINKWGSLEKMDEEYERRKKQYEKRKADKFSKELKTLRNKTRVDLWKKKGGGNEIRHTHVWDEVGKREGMTVMKCATCGMEKEELVM
ncbi:DNA repair protein [Ascobolus immersus RN42]|uniref:DNA repair protein RAD14 n=1 Tax=Ascobolus immersus RN42 TaxID=1160509 RepID=A0A3N4HZV2_ASCIM|nr:DNA repair protein [Ascobolus immersus RN42]